MTLTHRRILTVLLFFVLVILGPILLAYGSGYRINFEKKRIEQVGLLHVTTEPKKATLYIGDESHTINDELVLPSLSPNRYDLSIQKDGYHTWNKTLEINPNETTFIRDLTLFKNEPVLTIHQQAFDTYVSLENKVLVQNGAELSIVNLESGTTSDYLLPNEFELVFTHSIDNDSVLFSQNALWFIAKDGILEELTIDTEEAVLSTSVQGDRLYYRTTSGIYFTTINNSTTNEVVISQPFIQDMYIDGEEIWYLATEPSQSNSFLYHVREKGDRPSLVSTLPYSRSFELADLFRGFLTIEDQRLNKLHLVDTSITPARIETIESVNAWQWSNNHKQLLIATTTELTIFHFSNEPREELLLRLTSPIEDTLWEQNEKHVFFVNEDSLQLIERDERDIRNIYTFIQDKENLELIFANEKTAFALNTVSGTIELLAIPLQ